MDTSLKDCILCPICRVYFNPKTEQCQCCKEKDKQKEN